MPEVAALNPLARKEILKFAAANKSVLNAMQRFLQTAARALSISSAFSAFYDEEGYLQVHTWYGTDVSTFPRGHFLNPQFLSSEELRVVSDTASEPELLEDPWVKDHGIRFVAALPIRTSSKALIGMVCFMDTEPRAFSEAEYETLAGFTQMASETVLLRLENSLIRQAARKVQQVRVRLEKRIERVVSSLPVPFIGIDKKGKICFWNRAATDSFGYSQDDVEGQRIVHLVSTPSPSRKDLPANVYLKSQKRHKSVNNVEVLIKRVFNRRRISGIRLAVEMENGKSKDVLCRMFPYFDTEGEVELCVLVCTELSASQCSDVSFQQTQEQYREIASDMMRLKTAFLSNMSHEIRTPLTSIIGFADILGEQVDDANREFTQLIEESAQRLMGTLGAVLDLAQLEGHSLEVKLEPTNLIECTREVVASFEDEATEKGLKLRIEAGELYDAGVFLDLSAQKRIISNLISNAIKFTRKGDIVVKIEPDQERVKLSVEDSGIGISKEFLPHIFDEFQQESKGISRNFAGSGLGLAITKRLVGLMGGTIDVESKKGKGTKFVIEYPRHVSEYLAA